MAKNESKTVGEFIEKRLKREKVWRLIIIALFAGMVILAVYSLIFDNPNFIIEDGVAKLPDRSSFAGSVCTTNKLVRNMIELAGVSLLDAVRMATANPARMARLRDRGYIREGGYADILIFDENIDVSLTMVNGKVVFEK